MLQTTPSRIDFYPKLFVANLPWTVSDKELTQHFSQFGKVVGANVLFDSITKRSRCFGYVSFKNRDGFENALNAKVHVLEGRLLEVEPASSFKKAK